MECRLVVRVVVHPLDHINFAPGRPVRSYAGVNTQKRQRQGLYVPLLQKAGHVPHPVGMCTESMITRPPLKTSFDDIRMLLRFPETFWVVSTFMRTFPFEFTPMSPLDCYSEG